MKNAIHGHLTILVARTRRSFWSSPRPSLALLAAVVGTQVLATLITVYGLFMAPIGWTWALAVWAYALAWFFINDLVKRAAYRLFENRQETVLDAMRMTRAR